MTGCFKRDSMEDINIYTTVYPIEYIMDALYGENSNIESIYPNGIIIDDYTLTDKQIKDYSNCTLFKYNKGIKIIDATSSMEYDNAMEELWLNPSNLLMMAQNIKMGLDEYITNHYLLKDIDENYEEFKIKISNLDADMRLMAEEATTKKLVVANNLFNFLNKYGLEIVSLDGELSDKQMADLKSMIANKEFKYIYVAQNSELSDELTKMMEDASIEVVYIHTLSNITESERNDRKDYISIMQENIEKLKKELNK